jgi:hypothetical protein
MTFGGAIAAAANWTPVTFLSTKTLDKGEYYIDVEMYNNGDQSRDIVANGFAMLIEVIPL